MITPDALIYEEPLANSTSAVNEVDRIYGVGGSAELTGSPFQNPEVLWYFEPDVRSAPEWLDRIWNMALHLSGVTSTRVLTEWRGADWSDFDLDDQLLVTVRLRLLAADVSDSSAMFENVSKSLGITRGTAASLLGVGRTTPVQWSHGREPHPNTATRLLRLNAMADGIKRRLGDDGARIWWHAGAPSPIDVLLSDEFSRVEELAGKVIFSGSTRPEQAVTRFQYEDEDGPVTDATLSKPMRSRPRRAPKRRSS